MYPAIDPPASNDNAHTRLNIPIPVPFKSVGTISIIFAGNILCVIPIYIPRHRRANPITIMFVPNIKSISDSRKTIMPRINIFSRLLILSEIIPAGKDMKLFPI